MRTFYRLHSKMCEVKKETCEPDYAREFVAIAYIKDLSSAPLAWQASLQARV
jgi:hypothetical protein